MNVTNRKHIYIEYLLMVIGTGLMACSIQFIFDPINLVTGGFTGISIIIKALTSSYNGGIPLWLTNMVLNVPLLLLALWIKGFRFIWKTMFSTACLSIWLYILPKYTLVSNDLILASLFGGVIGGIGIGLVLMAKATTGGTDLMAALIQNKLRHYTVAQIMQVVDGVVVLAGAYVFGLSKALYAIVAIYITSRISDGILEGMKFAKVVYIITNHSLEISEAIMNSLNRGATGIKARGMYSLKEKEIIFCVVNKKEIVVLKDIVSEIDPKAFVIVSEAREVLGEGFLEYSK